MYCCPSCFSDCFLQNHIHAISTQNGKCSFCKAQNAAIIKPEELIDRFEPLLSLYTKDQSGNELNHLINCDWNVFSIIDNQLQRKLLKAISCDNELLKTKYRPVFSQERKNIEQWEYFREEIKHRNRFFPDHSLDKRDIEPFGKYIGKLIERGTQKLYRARINTSDKPFKKSDMGKPPKVCVSNGRANPIGIPYLYVASTIETAISEVRGHKGEIITVAEYDIRNSLELADLRDPRSTISPYELNDDDELELIYKNMPFLTLLGNELAKPIIPRVANLEYLSSQYLCELIKHLGFHGIIYKSAITEGSNYVIFNDRRLKMVKTFQYRIINVNTDSEVII